eukprot:808981-Rhodomonas_salina.1
MSVSVPVCGACTRVCSAVHTHRQSASLARADPAASLPLCTHRTVHTGQQQQCTPVSSSSADQSVVAVHTPHQHRHTGQHHRARPTVAASGR